MAKVKTAKEKITAYLKAKGYDATEIKDAFDELDSADTDLTSLAQELTQYKDTNTKWDSFWKETATPAFATLTQERDALKAQMDRLAAAGFKLEGMTPPPVPKVEEGKYITADQLEKFKNDYSNASSAVMKALNKVSMRHFKTFGTEPDLDAIEKLIAEGKARDIDHSYQIWSEPMYEKQREADTQKKIDEGIKKGVQDEISKQGIVMRKKSSKSDDVEIEELAKAAKAPKDAKGPSDRELKDAFIQDWNSLN